MSKKTKYQKKGETPMLGTISSVNLDKVRDNIKGYFKDNNPSPSMNAKPNPDMAKGEKFKDEIMNKLDIRNIINPGVPTNNTPLYIKSLGGAMNYKGRDYSNVKNQPKKTYNK